MNTHVTEKYGVFTAASLVVGIVIGSGIFFKADDILVYTNGSVLLGVLCFLLVGIGVIFGALCISQYALHSDAEGGIVAYSKMALGDRFSFMTGWMMVSTYFPSFIVVLAWVAALYTTFVIGTDSELVLWGLTILYLVCAYLNNVLNTGGSGKVQVITTAAKLIPLVVIAFVGLFSYGDLASNPTAIATSVGSDGNILLAIIAIAFAFDGWIIATSTSAEIRDSKKNLPKALIFGVIGILVIYILYFVGMAAIVGPEEIMALGDEHVGVAATEVFGPYGSTIFNTFVVISVYGGLNGMVLSYIRFPHAMVMNGVFKDPSNIKEIDAKYQVSLAGVKFTIPFIVFFVILNYLSMNLEVFTGRGFDTSSLAIIIVYFVYIVLFTKTSQFIKNGDTPKYYYAFIAIAIIISAIVIIGSLIPTPGYMIPNGVLYMLITAAMFIFAVPFVPKKN